MYACAVPLLPALARPPTARPAPASNARFLPTAQLAKSAIKQAIPANPASRILTATILAPAVLPPQITAKTTNANVVPFLLAQHPPPSAIDAMRDVFLAPLMIIALGLAITVLKENANVVPKHHALVQLQFAQVDCAMNAQPKSVAQEVAIIAICLLTNVFAATTPLALEPILLVLEADASNAHRNLIALVPKPTHAL